MLPNQSTLMGAYGGSITTGDPPDGARRADFQSPWEHGTGDVELVAGGVSGELAWLVMIERSSVKFTGYEDLRRWELRVTELFRLQNDDWVRFHRHADPLVEFHPLEEILLLVE